MLNTREYIHTPTDILLAKHKMWSTARDRRGDIISCGRGTLWITQEGDLNDYILEAGRNFSVTKPGIVVVQALDDSQFKYSLNEMQNHIEINHQPISPKSHSRIDHFLR